MAKCKLGNVATNQSDFTFNSEGAKLGYHRLSITFFCSSNQYVATSSTASRQAYPRAHMSPSAGIAGAGAAKDVKKESAAARLSGAGEFLYYQYADVSLIVK